MIEEKREVGTHMNKIGSESNRMRNSVKSGLCLLLGAALLFGCVPTPTEEAVTNKAEGRLENLILETRPIDGYAIAPESKEPQSDSAQLTEPEHAEKTDENRSNTLRFSLGASSIFLRAWLPALSARPKARRTVGFQLAPTTFNVLFRQHAAVSLPGLKFSSKAGGGILTASSSGYPFGLPLVPGLP